MGQSLNRRAGRTGEKEVRSQESGVRSDPDRGFAWQDGYGAFSIGHSQVARTIRYIAGQREHHVKVAFPDQFSKFVLMHDFPVDKRYLLG